MHNYDEQWKPVPFHPGYEVSSEGRVRSPRGKLMQQFAKTKRSGHLRLRFPGTGNTTVHRLVLEVFVGPCPPKYVCRHLNGNPADNRVKNLTWGTVGDNHRDDKWHGRVRPGCLSVEQVRRIKRDLDQGVKAAALARQFCVHRSTVSAIKRGVRHVDVTVAVDPLS